MSFSPDPVEVDRRFLFSSLSEWTKNGVVNIASGVLLWRTVFPLLGL